MTPIRWWQALGLVVLAVLGSMGVQAAIAGIYALIAGIGWVDAASIVGSDPLSLGISQLLGFGFAFVWGARSTDTIIEIRVETRRMLLYAFLAGAALQFPYAEIGALVMEAVGRDVAHETMVRHVLRPTGFLHAMAVVFSVLVVAPWTEELLFRGLLLPALSEAHGRIAGLLISAFLFGLMHGRPAAMVYAFAAGLVLGAVRLRTDSLLPCIVMHMATNAVPLLLREQLVAIPGVNTMSDQVQHVPVVWLLGGSLVAVLAILGLARTSDRQR